MTIRTLTTALATGLLLAPAGLAQDADPALEARLRLVDAWVERQMVDHLIPGASLALIHDQDVVWSAGYGYANREGNVAATSETAYSICSISKLFTSVAIMTLVEDGQIALDAPLSDYVPELDLPAPEGVLDEPITVRAALSHSAGLPREGGTPYWVEVDFPSRETLLERLADQERLYSPQDTWQYSNLGMAMLGEAITRVSGESYDSYIQSTILDPLGLSGVTTDLPNNEHGERFAVGYFMHDAAGQREPLEPYSINGIVPAAGFAASVEDLARFASWQFALLESGEESVLTRQTLREMHRVQWADPNDPDSPMWGLGFSHGRRGGDAVVGHGGYCPGYRADLQLRLPDQIEVTAMVNTNDVSPAMQTSGVYAITKSALTAEAPAEEWAFGDYEGVYGRPNLDRDTYVLPTADGLMLVSLFSSDPMENATTLVHVEGDTFRRKRDEGPQGETVRFERNEDGQVVRFWRHGNYMPRF